MLFSGAALTPRPIPVSFFVHMQERPTSPAPAKPETSFLKKKEDRRSFVKAFGLAGASLPLVVTLLPHEARAEGSGS